MDAPKLSIDASKLPIRMHWMHPTRVNWGLAAAQRGVCKLRTAAAPSYRTAERHTTPVLGITYIQKSSTRHPTTTPR